MSRNYGRSDLNACADKLLKIAVMGIAISKPVNPRIDPKMRRENITANGWSPTLSPTNFGVNKNPSIN